MGSPATAQTEVVPVIQQTGVHIELAGADIIPDADRKGQPPSLFWPWFAANISVLGIACGSYALGFGVSFVQAASAGLIGIVFSFLLCGFIALAGQRGGAPTMVLSRAALGVKGNRVIIVIGWVLTVGWETILVSLAVLAAATVLHGLGLGAGSDTTIKIIALLVVILLVLAGGIMGFDLIMRLQAWITVITGVLTIGYFILTAGHIDFQAVVCRPSGSVGAFIGVLVFIMTGFGLGWVNAAADYSRYLPRRASSKGVVGWTTFGAALAPVILLVFGLLLAGSDPKLDRLISADPVGALTTLLPTWYLVPFAVVAILGLVGGAVMDIYSSGLTLVSSGIPLSRPVAAAVDGVIMVLGTVYIVFGDSGFSAIFQGFLITLGIPVAAWSGIMLADIALRHKDYHDLDLFDPKGRYQSVRWSSIVILAIATVVGLGFVTNSSAGFLGWQGYFLGLIGGKDGAWAAANLGVLFALVTGFVAAYILSKPVVQAQEALDDTGTKTGLAGFPPDGLD